MSDARPSPLAARARIGPPSGRIFGFIIFPLLAFLAIPALAVGESADDRIPVLANPGPWNESPVAPGRSNYRLVIEYSAAPGTNAVLSLQGWKRLLPAGENLRAEFAIEDADDSPYIIRHWRAGRDLPDSTERPRQEGGAQGPEVTLTAPDGFRIHRAFIQPLRDADHAELWTKVSSAGPAIGAALYRDHCRACHGDSETAGQYPGLPAWSGLRASLSADPLPLWRAFNEPDGAAAGHPRLTDEEAYHVVRYLRENLLSSAGAAPPASDMPRGKVLLPSAADAVSSSAPWRRMDHGPFLFQPLSITDARGKTTLEVENSLILRLDPGIGGVTRGRVWAVYDIAGFRFLGLARGGSFSDSSAIFDGNGPPGLTLSGSVFEKQEAPPGEETQAAEFKAVTVSGREVSILSTANGIVFREHFIWKENEGPVREFGPMEKESVPGKPDPTAKDYSTRVVLPDTAGGAPLAVEAIPAPAPEDVITASWFRFTGLATRGDGDVFLCTPNGEVWLVRGLYGAKPAPRWRRFASGLDGPYRLSEVDGVFEARCRNGIFRLLDRNKDGTCESYERKPEIKRHAESSPIGRLSRYSDPARTGDGTWYHAMPHAKDKASPGTSLIRRDGNTPEPVDPRPYVWLPGAESIPPAGPVWLPATSQWGGGLQSGMLLPCRDSGMTFRLWCAQPGDLSLPRILWSLPIPPLQTDIMASAFAGSSLYFCGLPLDEETSAHVGGFWRVRRQKGHLFHPVEFAADAQSVTLRFNAPLDAAATAASRFARVTAWQPDGAFSDAQAVAPRRVLLGRNTMRVVSDVIKPGGGLTLECAVTDGQGLSHRFTVHFTLPEELPPAVLPAPPSRPLPPPVVDGVETETEPATDPAAAPLPDDFPSFEWPGRLPELDDPVEEEEPLPTR